MAVLVHAGEAYAQRWYNAIRAVDPSIDVRILPDIGAPEDIELMLTWNPPPGVIARLPRLRAVQCSGAGVDQLMQCPELPLALPVARTVDSAQARDLAAFALAVALAWFRRLDAYREQQAAREWRRLFPHPSVDDVNVGVLGNGIMGQTIRQAFAGCGFTTAAWQRQPRQSDASRVFSGEDGLDTLLSQTNILVCALPLTPQTVGCLNATVFRRLRTPAYLINVGRGAHVVEADLLSALDQGHLDGAALDVFETEPLSVDSSLWPHPGIRVTPHIGAFATPERVADQVVENLRRAREGRPLLNTVDRDAGY